MWLCRTPCGAGSAAKNTDVRAENGRLVNSVVDTKYENGSMPVESARKLAGKRFSSESE